MDRRAGRRIWMPHKGREDEKDSVQEKVMVDKGGY